MAGVSVDYYTRLEQGRARNVSAQVLDALAEALKLDALERDYLYALARPAAGRPRTRRRRRRLPGSGRWWMPSILRRRCCTARSSRCWR